MSAAKQLLDLLHPRLEQVTTMNGYALTMQRVSRAKLTPFDFRQDLPAINYWPAATTLFSDGPELGYGYQLRDLSLTIEAYNRTSDRPFTDVAAELAEAIEIAMLRATSAPQPTAPAEWLLSASSSNAGYVFVDRITYATGQGQEPYCGCVLECRIRYKIETGKPDVLLALP